MRAVIIEARTVEVGPVVIADLRPMLLLYRARLMLAGALYLWPLRLLRGPRLLRPGALYLWPLRWLCGPRLLLGMSAGVITATVIVAVRLCHRAGCGEDESHGSR